MGLIISASLLCDNDNTTTVSLASADAPIPDGWARVEGYLNIGGGESDPLTGYFCPACIVALGTRGVVKKTADISPNLAAPS